MNLFPILRRQRGFTLIELLVVIAIIALLAAILFPVFSRARENARRSSCSSNLKQIGIGIHQYTQDFDERYPLTMVSDGSGGSTSISDNFMDPNGTGWLPNAFYACQPYLQSTQILICPSTRRATGATRGPTALSDTSYAINAVLMDVKGPLTTDVIGRQLSEVGRPSEIVMVQEYYEREKRVTFRPKWYGGAGLYGSAAKYSTFHVGDGTTIDQAYSNIHFDGGNLLFIDGHVKFKQGVALTQHDFGLVPTSGWGGTTGGNYAFNLN